MSVAATNIKGFLQTLPERVTLVAVTKTIPVEIIRTVYDQGYKKFGENKVQEILTKKPCLPEDIDWHMIGHLQSNKVKYIAPFIKLIHSVDNSKLLRVINNEGVKNKRKINCLLQIHIAEEETKYGFSFDEAEELLASSDYQSYNNIKICGLMGMATFTNNMDQVRKEFRGLADFFTYLGNKYFYSSDHFSELSMGMSGDYKVALEEGATMVRIGSLIFGERIKP